jgi:hypothetical protein
MRARDLYLSVLILFFAAGLILPATQSSSHPRPDVQGVLGVLFVLDSPLRKAGVDDLFRVPVNILTTLGWGAFVALLLSVIPGVLRPKTSNQSLDTNGDPLSR